MVNVIQTLEAVSERMKTASIIELCILETVIECEMSRRGLR